MLLRNILYIYGILFPLIWIVHKILGTNTLLDTGTRLLIFVLCFVVGYGIQKSSGKRRDTLRYIAYLLLISITYYNIHLCYISQFSLENIVMNLVVYFLTILTLDNAPMMFGYFALALIGNFISSVIVLDKTRFYHFIIPTVLSYLGSAIVQYLRIKERNFLFLKEDYIEKSKFSEKDGVIITDTDTRILYINDIAKKYVDSGFDKEFLLLTKVIFPVDELDQKIGYPRIIELSNDSHIEVHYSRVEYQSDPCFMIRIFDRTNEIRSDREYRRVHKIQSEIIEFAGEGIVYLNNEGFVQYLNEKALKLLDLTREEIIGETFHNKVHHSNFDGTTYDDDTFPVKETYLEGKSFHIPLDVFWKKDGSFFYTEYISTPVLESGRPVGAVLIFRDISGKKKQDDLDKQYRDELLHLSNTSNRFLEIYTQSELFRYIAEELHSITNGSAIVVNSFDPDLDIFTIRAHAGFGKYFTELYNLLGRDLKGFYYSLDSQDPAYELNRTDNTKSGIEDGLFELKFGNFNRKICKQIEYLVSSKKIFILSLNYKGYFLGNVIIFHKQEVFENSTMVEVFQNQACINLHRKIMERSIFREKFRYDTVIQESSIFYCELNMDGIVLFINPALEELLDYSREELVGKNWWSVVQPGMKYEEIQEFLKHIKVSPTLRSKSSITTKKNIQFDSTWDWIYKSNPDSGDEIITGIGLEVNY